MPGIWDSLREGVSGALRAGTQLARQFELTPGATGEQQPTSNALGALSHMLSLLGESCFIQHGKIHECVPYARAYRVALENGPIILCNRLSHSPMTPIGVADHSTLQPGVQVFVLKHPVADWGTIIGVDPGFAYDGRNSCSDVINQGSNVGVAIDSFFKSLLSIGPDGTNAGIIDFSARQPTDSLEIGDFIHTSDTGQQIFMDSYRAHMRVDEYCGIFMYYLDSLLRIAGQQFELWTPGLIMQSRDDEGEILHYEGIAVYPWEQQGLLAGPTESGYREFSAEQCQRTQPWYGSHEPAYDDMMPFHRVRQWGRLPWAGRQEHDLRAARHR